MDENEQKTSTWLRIAEIIVGLILLVLGGYAITYPVPTAAILLAFLAVGLVVLGGIEFARVFTQGASGWQRLLSLILSIFAILLALAVLIAPLIVGAVTLGWVVALAIIFAGFSVAARGTPGAMIVGIIVVILGLVALINPIAGVITAVVLMSIALIVFGLELIISGLLGRWV